MPEDGLVLRSHHSQPELSLAQVVVAAELVVREKKQPVRRTQHMVGGGGRGEGADIESRSHAEYWTIGTWD